MPLVSDSYPYLPIWLFGLIFFAALLISREGGHAMRKRMRQDQGKDQDDTFAMTSVLGLFALLIGFTFSISMGKHEARRALVVQEANALGTTWLRTDLLDSPDREALQVVLRRYVAERVSYGSARNNRAELEAYARTVALQSELWAQVMRSVAPFRDTPRASLLVGTTNESIDLAATRQAERQAHVPARIQRMLVLFAIAAAGMVGYERGTRRRATTLLFVLLTLAVTLVFELDRPGTGTMTVPQQPMLDLKASIDPANSTAP